MVEQLSIFAENTKGAMAKITSTVSDAGINLYNVVTNDSAEFGIIRMLTSDSEMAASLLTKEGYMCHIGKCIGVEIPDDIGSLSTLLSTITDAGINIDYVYVSYSRDSKTPVAIIHASGYAEIEECLSAKGYTLI